jgi:diguanylate cyclase (GGDEF)-like protein
MDFLTGLATGEELQARAREAAAEGGGSTTIATLEIVGLRAINETFGRAVGDAAIQATGKVIKSQVRSSDLAGRIGAGSFAVLMPSGAFEDAKRLLARIEDLLPGACHDLDCVVEFSSGAAEWDGQETVRDLMARANVWVDAHSANRDSDTVLSLPTLTGLPRVG